MKFEGSVVLVTGANRGLGEAFTRLLLEHGAAWSLTNSLRVELATQGTLVVGVHVGFMDTDMAAGVDAPEVTPESVVEATLDALLYGRPEVLADDASRFVKSQLSSGLENLYPSLVPS